MSLADSAAPERPGPSRQGGTTGGVLRWLPGILFVLALIGVVLVLPSVARDQAAREFYRGRVGGSSLYGLDVTFARLMPFLIAASVALAVLQRLGRRRTHAISGEMVQRHELTEVLTHWLNGAGLGLGLLTAAWLLRWLQRPVSLETVYLIHFAGASLMLVAVAHHLAYQLIGGGNGLLVRSRADLKNAFAEVLGYTGVYRGMRGVFGIQLPLALRRPAQRLLRRYDVAPAHAGKYLATEKVLSYSIWAILVGIVVITGIIKTLNYLLPVPAALRQVSTFLHDGATIFLLIFLVIHVSALALVPRNWALLKSMFTTRISRSYVREHLPLWSEELEDSPEQPQTKL